MYMMYVDESGDSGNNIIASRYFILSGLVMHESHWKTQLGSLNTFRNIMKVNFGLKLREEIHAFNMISKPGALVRIPRNDRLTILRHFMDTIENLPGVSVINVVVDKFGKPTTYDPFEQGWQALIQRFENTVVRGNFPGPHAMSDHAMIFPDDTNRKKLTDMIRRMRYYNPVPNSAVMYGAGYRNLKLQVIIEDPHYKDSQHSYFTQAADCVAYMLHQQLAPNKYIRKKTGHGYFNRLNTCLCRVASSSDPMGIVRL